jgi:endonuclease YncB( thermonuclease family)
MRARKRGSACGPTEKAPAPEPYLATRLPTRQAEHVRRGRRTFGTECYGSQASATTKALLPPGTRVRLFPEPATDRVDQYGRLLRYVVRVKDGVNVNVQLVRVGAAAPYFYEGRRGRYAALLERLALRARAKRLGLWGRCPHTPYTPDKGVSTRP